MLLTETAKAGEVTGWIENRDPECHISDIYQKSRRQEVPMSSLEFSGKRNLEMVNIWVKLTPGGKSPWVDSGLPPSLCNKII